MGRVHTQLSMGGGALLMVGGSRRGSFRRERGGQTRVRRLRVHTELALRGTDTRTLVGGRAGAFRVGGRGPHCRTTLGCWTGRCGGWLAGFVWALLYRRL